MPNWNGTWQTGNSIGSQKKLTRISKLVAALSCEAVRLSRFLVPLSIAAGSHSGPGRQKLRPVEGEPAPSFPSTEEGGRVLVCKDRPRLPGARQRSTRRSGMDVDRLSRRLRLVGGIEFPQRPVRSRLLPNQPPPNQQPKALDCCQNYSSPCARSAPASPSPNQPPPNQPAEGLGLRKPAAAFPEPARWPGTNQAHHALPPSPLAQPHSLAAHSPANPLLPPHLPTNPPPLRTLASAYPPNKPTTLHTSLSLPQPAPPPFKPSQISNFKSPHPPRRSKHALPQRTSHISGPTAILRRDIVRKNHGFRRPDIVISIEDSGIITLLIN